MIKRFVSLFLIFILFSSIEARPTHKHRHKYKKIHKSFAKYSAKKQKRKKLPPVVTANSYNPEIEKKRLMQALKKERDSEKKVELYSQISALYQNSQTYSDQLKAIYYIKKAIDLSKNKWYYYAILANIYSYMKPSEFLNAKKYYEKAIESTDSNYNKSLYYSYISRLYTGREYPNYVEGEKYLLKAIDVTENDYDKANYYIELANLNYNSESKFLEYQNKALEAAPDPDTQSYIYSNIANFYFNNYREFKQEEFDKAVEYMEKAIATTKHAYNKVSYCASLAYGMKFKRDLDTNEIVKIYRRAIEYSINSYDKSYYYGLIANLYTEMQPPENEKAISEYEQAIKHSSDPATIESYKSMVKVLKSRMKK
ncbi:MAG TPA: hypothetical protein PK079_20940 [Leptospiraceae bacterium]|nr:hypothetical protein [Leptospiraceae bacterium]HMX34136.1 hypothetical protein [Leptospiraceae bacterium]HMY34303.1 hypothetical protein [Leptospiraceae bacterium]HNC58856.1 hypothetical protein [Leptospiraceae bacterium]HNE10990.1 hypothetical protein [Leptospiraceae bacterium]